MPKIDLKECRLVPGVKSLKIQAGTYTSERCREEHHSEHCKCLHRGAIALDSLSDLDGYSVIILGGDIEGLSVVSYDLIEWMLHLSRRIARKYETD